MELRMVIGLTGMRLRGALRWMKPRVVQHRESVSPIAVRIDCGEAGACAEIGRARERLARSGTNNAGTRICLMRPLLPSSD